MSLLYNVILVLTLNPNSKKKRCACLETPSRLIMHSCNLALCELLNCKKFINQVIFEMGTSRNSFHNYFLHHNGLWWKYNKWHSRAKTIDFKKKNTLMSQYPIRSFHKIFLIHTMQIKFGITNRILVEK